MATKPKNRPRTRAPKIRALTFADMMAVERVSQPAVSPDGRTVAFVTSRHDPQENKVRHRLRLLDLTSGRQKELTPGPGNHSQPAWSPDGTKLAFASDRDPEAGSQLWILPVAGGEAQRVTSGYGGVQTPLWAPDSRRILFARSIVVSADYRPSRSEKPDPKEGPPSAKVYGLVNEKSSARVAERLLFRHWRSWTNRERSHLFLLDTVTGNMEDVTPFDRDVPPLSLGSGRDYDFHPSGDEIAFAMNPDEVVTRSTNNSIFLQRIRGLKPVGEALSISTSEACDCHPRYSRDGSRLYYLAMSEPGYEADRNRIKIYGRKTKKTTLRLERFDRSPEEFVLAADGDGDSEDLLFLAQDRGRRSVYRLALASGRVTQLTQGTTNGTLRTIPGARSLLVTRESTTAPADFYRLEPGDGIAPPLKPGPAPHDLPTDAGMRAQALTRFSGAVARAEMNPVEDFWYEGADDDPVHGLLIRPPGFRSGKRYPLILLIHGGPQAAWLDCFHYRWNAQMFATRGAVVALLNPRGSTGYGHKFAKQISRDWGGRCYRDLMLGLDYLLKKHSFLDPKRVAAAGASFGGFMVNWIAGHSDRFRCLVCHDGIFNAETMAYTTDELWFDEYEHGGLPHEKRRSFLKFSPHLAVADFKTPMLVIHGEQDFRCPLSEGIGMFTALQVLGVPSRYLHFPDEGHWIEKPANAEVWYHEVLGWLTKYLEEKGSPNA